MKPYDVGSAAQPNVARSPVSVSARKAITALIVMAGSVFIVVAAAQTASNVWTLATIARGTFQPVAWPSYQSGTRLMPPIVARSDTGRERDLTGGRTLILSYSTTCNACALNMARWIDLIARADSTTHIVAVSRNPLVEQKAYWGALAARVTLIQLAPYDSTLQTWLPDRVPATAILNQGKVSLATIGILDAPRLNRFHGALQ